MSRKILYYAGMLLLFTRLTAQEPVERTLKPFSKLVAGDKVMVRLVKSDRESATIKTQGIDAGSVTTEISGNTLSVGIHGESFTKKKVVVTLSYVHLDAIAVNGGAEISTTALFKADSLSVDIKSGGMLYLDADIEYLSAKVIEGGILSAEGYATEQDLVVATSGTVSAFDLESETIKVKASTGGKAKINVEKELDAEVGSKGFVSYKGNPAKINRKVSSGGSLSEYQP
jgi:hypothetical protein